MGKNSTSICPKLGCACVVDPKQTSQSWLFSNYIRTVNQFTELYSWVVNIQDWPCYQVTHMVLLLLFTKKVNTWYKILIEPSQSEWDMLPKHRYRFQVKVNDCYLTRYTRPTIHESVGQDHDGVVQVSVLLSHHAERCFLLLLRWLSRRDTRRQVDDHHVRRWLGREHKEGDKSQYTNKTPHKRRIQSPGQLT